MTLVFGPDNAVWYADASGGAIVKVQQTGKATIFSQGAHYPLTIAAGDNGSLWYTLIGQPEIDQLTPSGNRIAHPLPPGKLPDSIVRGANGAMWFISAENQIGRRSSDGTFQFYHVQMDRRAPPPDGFGVIGTNATTHYTSQLVAASDGSAWVLPVGSHSLTQVTADGSLLEFTVPEKIAVALHDPLGASGDGSIWFSGGAGAPADNFVGFLDSAKHFHVFKTPSGPGPLTVDKHGVAWGLIWGTSETTGSQEVTGLAKITPSGSVTEFSTPEGEPIDLLFNGWGGDLWAETVDKQGNKVFAQVVTE